jgi:branched-chain amino acid transport system ATP-binding protein
MPCQVNRWYAIGADKPNKIPIAPGLVREVFEKIAQISKETKISILVVEQKVREVLEICNRVYSMKLGKIAFEGKPELLKTDRDKLKQLFL